MRTIRPLTGSPHVAPQLAAEDRLPFDALHTVLPGLRGQVGRPGRHQREDGLDLLPPGHHRAHTVCEANLDPPNLNLFSPVMRPAGSE